MKVVELLIRILQQWLRANKQLPAGESGGRVGATGKKAVIGLLALSTLISSATYLLSEYRDLNGRSLELTLLIQERHENLEFNVKASGLFNYLAAIRNTQMKFHPQIWQRYSRLIPRVQWYNYWLVGGDALTLHQQIYSQSHGQESDYNLAGASEQDLEREPASTTGESGAVVSVAPSVAELATAPSYKIVTAVDRAVLVALGWQGETANVAIALFKKRHADSGYRLRPLRRLRTSRRQEVRAFLRQNRGYRFALIQSVDQIQQAAKTVATQH